MKTTRISKLKITVAPLALGLAMISAPSFAQDTAAGEDGASEAIVVTGSRIARANLESASPVTVVTADDFKTQGAVSS